MVRTVILYKEKFLEFYQLQDNKIQQKIEYGIGFGSI